jgi:tetratricopeptide (TPR) repeat protein
MKARVTGAVAIAAVAISAWAVAEGERGAPPVEEAALRLDWAAVGRGARDLPSPMRDVLLGYAAMQEHEWCEAWTRFRAADESKDKDALLQWAVKVCERHPGSGMALLLRGDALARQGRYDQAVAALDEALRLQPELTLALDLRGLVKLTTGALGEAGEDLEQACQADPTQYNASFERGVLSLIAGNLEDAVARLTALLDQQDGFFLARNARGVAYSLLGQYGLALDDLRRAGGECVGFPQARDNEVLAALLRAKGVFSVDLRRMARATAKGLLGSLTMVVTDPKSMSSCANIAADCLRANRGGNVVVTDQLDVASRSAQAGENVVLTLRTGLGPGDALGESVRSALSDLGHAGVGRIDILAADYDGSRVALEGARRFMSDPGRMKIGSVSILEPGGGVNRLALPSHEENARLARTLMDFGVNVTVGTTTGNIGLPRIGEVSAYERQGIPTYIAQSRTDLGLTASLSVAPKDMKLGLGLSPKLSDEISSVGANDGRLDVSWMRPLPDGSRINVGRSSTVDLLTSPLVLDRSLNTGLSTGRIAGDRSGVFLRLGEPGLDATRTDTADLSGLQGATTARPSPAAETRAAPDFVYPMLIFNPTPDDGGPGGDA